MSEQHGEADARPPDLAAPTAPTAIRTPVEQSELLLESFSLPSSEAKMLVALLRMGTATPTQLGPITGIARTNVYRVLESLLEKQLAHRSPGRNAVWVPASRDEVIWRLHQAEEQRFRGAEQTLEKLRSSLEEIPEPQEKATAVFQVTDEVSQGFRYVEEVASATSELLVFNRGPYPGEISVSTTVLEALARGVKGRAIWQTAELYSSGAEHVLKSAVAYARAGVDTRVVEHLPLSIAVIDRKLTLLRVPADKTDDLPYAATATVQNVSFAETMARVFEQSWQEARPLDFSGNGDHS